MSDAILDAKALLDARHGSTATDLEMTAQPSYPHSQMSALMQSPCRPEENGYFGATYGIPSEIRYDFEVEARQGADVEYAALVIQEHLMDVVLSVTFPSLCSYEGDGRPPARKTQDVIITGFRFGREEFDMSRTCTPLGDKSSHCNRFSGKLNIYGSDIKETVSYAQSVIHFAISGALAHVESVGIQRVETVNIVREDDTGDDESILSISALWGFVIAAICIIIGILLLFLYMSKDRARQQRLRKLAQRTMSTSTSGSYRYFNPNGKHAGETDHESANSEISSVHIDFEKGAVSKMPKGKIDVEFDTDYESSCGLVSEDSEDCYTQDQGVGPGATMSHPPHYLDEQGRNRD